LFIVGVTSSIHIMGIPMPCTRHHHFHGFPFRSIPRKRRRGPPRPWPMGWLKLAYQWVQLAELHC
jgi:hypothetical protein